MKKILWSLPILFSANVSLEALDQVPWYGEVYAFRSDIGFLYSYFHKVNGAIPNQPYPSNNYVPFVGAGFTLSQDWDLDLDFEMARTPRQNFSPRSLGLQARYRFFNDIAGDFITLVSGINVRGVTPKSVRDISSPYASYLNFELTTSVGKEKSLNETWTMRGFFGGALGMATQGYPWARFYSSFELNSGDVHRGGFLCDGYFGLGGKQYVPVDHFKGWGHIQHDSVDVGVFYRYRLNLWGTFMLSYSCRVFAHNFPEYEQRGILRYEIPFSLF
ncbi:MAG: hypothetical protein EBZ47_00440 [Chlamydiae bacterium]|nr:hypothetical protein [Chlamydiota bacterium]